MKTQLSIKIATRSRRLGVAVKGMSEWGKVWESGERGTDHQVGGQRFSWLHKRQEQKNLDFIKNKSLVRTGREAGRRAVGRRWTNREG